MRYPKPLHALGKLKRSLAASFVQRLHLAMLRIGAHLGTRYHGIRTGPYSTFSVLVEVSWAEPMAVVAERFTARRHSASRMSEGDPICHDRLDKS